MGFICSATWTEVYVQHSVSVLSTNLAENTSNSRLITFRYFWLFLLEDMTAVHYLSVFNLNIKMKHMQQRDRIG